MKLKQIVVAHRGAKGLVPFENTIEAFAKAIEVNADCIEIDIRKTKDNIIAVYHDKDIDGVLLADLTYNQLLGIAKEKGYHIPTLEETVLFVKGKILLDVEFKEVGYEKEVIDIILKHLKYDEFFIRSFNDETILAVKNYDKKVLSSLLLGKDKPKNVLRVRLSELFPYLRLKRCKADFVSPHYRLLKFGYVTRMKIMNYPISVWTVDDRKLMEKLYHKKKVWSMVTNYPNIARDVLDKKKSE